MLGIGRHNELVVSRITEISATLLSEAGDILLPKKYLPVGVRPGDRLTVFVYRDSEDRVIATTLEPKAQVGEFAVLEVKEAGPVGAFLDWGLEKDLLVPFSEQPRPMQKGEKHLVRLYLDRSSRVAASARVGRFLERSDIRLKTGEEVAVTFYEFTELGAKVIVNGRYAGLVFRNELCGRFEPGATARAYVKKVREDGKIDVTLRKGGTQDLSGGRESILRVLGERGGFLPVGDKSSPEAIYELFTMSKKTFKTIIGNLYRQGIIEIRKDGIRLR